MQDNQTARKNRVTVKIAGKEYTIAGYTDPERVHRIAVYVNRRMDELAAATGLPASQLSVLAAMNIADDMFAAQDENRALRKEIDKNRANYIE